MLSIVYITCREKCFLEWTVTSLISQLNQTPFKPQDIQWVIVDKVLQDWKNDPVAVESRKSYIQTATDMEHQGWDSVTHVSPKPTPYQGPYKLTPIEYFAAANARNTGVCYAKHNYVVFVDDTSLLVNGWLRAVYEGLMRPDRKHVICGAYKKVSNLQVDLQGQFMSGEMLPQDFDNRLSSVPAHVNGPIPWSGGAMYGCSFALPVEGFIEINGMNEMCDGLGAEDYDFGIRIERAGYKVYYDKRMMTLEEKCPQPLTRPVCRQDPLLSLDQYVKLIQEFKLDMGRIKPPSSHRNDQSHFMLDLLEGQPHFIRANSPHFDLRALRHDTLLNRCQLHEYVWWRPDMVHFFTKQPLVDYHPKDGGRLHDSLYRELETIIPTLEGWCTVEKAKALSHWIIHHQPGTCVEIGVFAGRSLLAMGFALRYNGHGKIIGVDPWSAPAALEGKNHEENDKWWSKIDYEHFYNYTLNKIRDYGLNEFVSVLRAKSVDAVKGFLDQEVDLVHIDGNHSEETSTLDVNLWAPKIKLGGAIVMDDTDWQTTKNAQIRIVELGFELEGDYGTWRLYTKKRHV